MWARILAGVRDDSSVLKVAKLGGALRTALPPRYATVATACRNSERLGSMALGRWFLVLGSWSVLVLPHQQSTARQRPPGLRQLAHVHRHDPQAARSETLCRSGKRRRKDHSIPQAQRVRGARLPRIHGDQLELTELGCVDPLSIDQEQ